MLIKNQIEQGIKNKLINEGSANAATANAVAATMTNTFEDMGGINAIINGAAQAKWSDSYSYGIFFNFYF